MDPGYDIHATYIHYSEHEFSWISLKVKKINGLLILCMCRYEKNPENFVVYVGKLDLTAPNQLPLRVLYIYLHEDYNSVAYYNDIALLKVSSLFLILRI